MRRFSGLCVSLMIAAVCMSLAGCGKPKVSAIPEKKAEPKDAVVAKPAPIDTSDNVSFKSATDLGAELEKKIKEKLLAVHFEYNSFSLTSETTDRLGIVAQFLNEYPTMRILIEGHCDERGSSEYNMGLGENRARAVKNYLSNYGIAANRVEITSFGKERPIANNCSDDPCHMQNRRGEFKVLAK